MYGLITITISVLLTSVVGHFLPEKVPTFDERVAAKAARQFVKPKKVPLPSSPPLPQVNTAWEYIVYSDSQRKDIPLNSSCQRLRGELYHNIGSIYIPCEAPKGKKNICTLYRDSTCQSSEAMVTFDHSHYNLFSDPNLEDGITYVGGLVGSVDCTVVDVSTEVANTNGHPSTQHPSQCPGDSCQSDKDCHMNGKLQLYCSKDKTHPNTCQPARYIPQGNNCLEDMQCTEGYCADTFTTEWRRCDKKRWLGDKCSTSEECETGAKCCESPGDPPIIGCFEHCRGEFESKCKPAGLPCWKNSACCSGNCHYSGLAIISGQCER